MAGPAAHLQTGKDGKPGKWTKVPTGPATGRPASVTDPTAWGTLAAAVAACARFGCDGIGYAFAAGDPFVGVDWDGCRDPETGAIDPAVADQVDRLDTFTEISSSGTGLHAILEGTLPPGGNRTGRTEVYSRGRFFVVTGHPLPGHAAIGRRDGELAAWHAETFPPKAKPAAVPFTDRAQLDVGDGELLRRCQGSPRFARLWDGDDGDYGGDASAADLAFCNVVVRNGGDRGQADALYRRSPRARQKWDERRGDRTYGEMTLDQAFDGTVVPWRPAPRSPKREGPNTQDAHSLPDDAEELKAMVRSLMGDVAELTRRVEAAECGRQAAQDRIETMAHLQRQTMWALRNKNLGTEKQTGIALAFELASQQSVHPDQEEFAIPYARLADQAGLHESTVALHIKKKLNHLGMFERRTQFVPERTNLETGEYWPAKTQTMIKPLLDPRAMLDVLASAEHATGVVKGNHGGKADRGRLYCPSHPTADVVKRVTYHCGICDQLLCDEQPELVPSEATAEDIAASRGTPNAQDARSVGDEPHAEGSSGQPTRSVQTTPHPPPVARTKGRIGRVYHNVAPSIHPNAADWSHVRSFIGADPPPLRPALDYEEVAF